MDKEFELLDHTADIGVRAYGTDLKETFANAARGLFSIITELDTVRDSLKREIEVTAPDRELLLVEWLNELVYLFDVENILFSRFDITELSDTRLKAIAHGEKVDKSRHQLKLGIKSATYHMLKIEKTDGVYQAQILFDI